MKIHLNCLRGNRLDTILNFESNQLQYSDCCSMMMIDVVHHFSYSLLNETTTNKETLEFPKLIPTLAVS